ncbi:MAG: cyclic nucleotide-binding domain-containing protein [Candidatus Nitrohelix vancouverensis]|uniref:Cyclic nucleotide-binding domain-containing protein n=1 Tax=Candidatus Nitrohelix vancouverensis TaxID=2705534 RepID=A0A7T0C257_9BACT|nr:MAG: cyclic nucleotide-binding domain-containing protein [Candidatus Nitrohelix vancouverensis]
MNMKDTPIHQRFAKGDVIVSEGIKSNNAYVVISGKVHVTKRVDKKTIVIGTLGEGEVFGEMGLISEKVRSANVVAMGDVVVGVIDKDKFDEHLKNLPEDFSAVITALVERLRMTTDMLARIGIELNNTQQKLNSFTLHDN